MRATNRLARWCWATCVLGAVGLHAQDVTYNAAIKLRMDTTTVDKDNLAKTGYGIGAEYLIPVSSMKIGVELGYFYKTGDPYIQAPAAVQGGKDAVGAGGGDSRRNQLEGISLRFTAYGNITEGLGWQGGLMLGGTKFRHQYVGDMASEGWADRNAQYTTAWRDTYQGTPEEGGIKPSLFGGVSWNIDPTQSLEFNLMLLNYTAVEYRHVAGGGTYSWSNSNGKAGWYTLNNQFPQDSLVKSSRLVPHLEIAYAFHF